MADVTPTGNTWVIPIGYDVDIPEMKVGDGLLIVFCSHRKFCVTSNSPGVFPNNILPSGNWQPGQVWPTNGSPAIAAAEGTIQYTSRSHDNHCPPAGQGGAGYMGGHTIIVRSNSSS